MSLENPIIAITGASGAGTTIARLAFSAIFRREGIKACFLEGDSFRRHDCHDMTKIQTEAELNDEDISHFGPEANLFDDLENLFREYSQHGTGKIRHYVKDENQDQFEQPLGSFTPWEPIPEDSDLLFYEGFHGGVVASKWTRRKMDPSHNPKVVNERRSLSQQSGVDVAQYVDLLIGIVPVINLEWIQKIHRDTSFKGHSHESVTQTILSRMDDYINFIIPQFSYTDINFQRVPVVDTSNPFIAREIPADDECILVVRFRDPKRYSFPFLLQKIEGSYMSRANTMVMPGNSLRRAFEIVCTPLIQEFCG